MLVRESRPTSRSIIDSRQAAGLAKEKPIFLYSKQYSSGSLTPSGNIRYQLKAPCRDGTTHVIFEPLDFIARLVALVPRPRVNLTHLDRFFAPYSKHRPAPFRSHTDRSSVMHL